MPGGFQDISPRPGIEFMPPAVEVQSPNNWTTREFPMILVVLRNTCQVCSWNPFYCNLIFFFFIIRLWLGMSQRKIVPLSPQHIKGTHYQHDLSVLILPLITWLRWCWSGVFIVKLPPSPFHTVPFVRKSLCTAFI